jgi:peroxiredoxin
MNELGEFVKHFDELKALKVQVLGVSIDTISEARMVQQRLKAPFPVLSDSGLKVMGLYGTASPIYRVRDGRPINTPTLVLIDRKGIIRWIHQAEDYRIRAPISQDLEQIRKLK